MMEDLRSRLRCWLRRNEPMWIEPDQLQRQLDSGDRPLVLDVRSAEEFSGALGHIEGAVNLPLAELPVRLTELGAESRSVVCVCLTDKRSAQAAAAIAAAGHLDVGVLRGGMRRWRHEGFGSSR
jgi:rhodanese-related sulfurtransferase